MRLLTWPNAITVLRFPLAAVFVLVDSVAARSVVAAVAGLSDAFDGWLARKAGSRSRSGELLDPIADKTFVFAAMVGFVVTGEIRFWQFLVLIARDLYVVAAFVVASAFGLRIRFRSRPSGKWVTALQIVAVLILLLVPQAAGAILAAVAVAGAWAVIDYTRAGIRSLRGEAEQT